MVKDEEKKEMNDNTIAVLNYLLKSLFFISLRSLHLCGSIKKLFFTDPARIAIYKIAINNY